jgi:hypothetical protein
MATGRRKVQAKDSAAFAGFVRAVKGLIDDGVLRVRVSPNGDMSLRVVDEDAVTTALNAQDMAREQSALWFTQTVPEILVAISRRRRSWYVSFYEDLSDERQTLAKGQIEARRRELEERLRIVEEIMIDERLQTRLAIKRTAKLNTFSEVQWEVNEKEAEGGGPIRKGVRYGILKVDVERSDQPEDPAYYPLAARHVPADSHVFVIEADDLRELIDSLQKLARELNA